MKGKGSILLPQGFKKIARLGGGMGTSVWKVEQEATGEVLALKIYIEANPTHRLQREFAILKRLDIPGVVKVKESGQHEDRDYFTMGLVDGKPFTNYMTDHRDQGDFVERFLKVFQRSLVVLSELHKQGIVHIDVKPSNLLVTRDGNPTLLDFGFAEDYALSPAAESAGTTLDYAAPELFTGGYVVPAADIYSLGALAYEVLSGRKLWEGLTTRELIAAKLSTPPGLGALDFELPSGIEGLILRMINPDPGLRPLAAEVLSEISWLTKEKEAAVSTPVMVPRLVFGGRDEEIVKLEGLVFEDKRGVILAGESGTGKTRLLRELRLKALVDGRNILHIEGRGAHISLVDYISSTLHIKDPEKEQRPDKWSRYERVYQGIEKDAIDGVFIDAPLDLSEDEKGLLGYLARGFDGKMGFILAQVPAETHPEAVSIELSPLSKEKISELISKTFGELKTGSKLTDTISSVTQGNPRRMNELLDLLHNQGWLSWNRRWMYEPSKDEKGLAVKLDAWLGEKIDRLDDQSRMVLDMLALAERPLPDEVIEEIIGEDAQTVIAGLVNAGFVRSTLYLDRPHYELANDLTMPIILYRITEDKRKILSGKLAESWEEKNQTLSKKDINFQGIFIQLLIGKLYLVNRSVEKALSIIVPASMRLIKRGDWEKTKQILIEILKENLDRDTKKQVYRFLGVIALNEFDVVKAEEYYTNALDLIDNDSEEKASLLIDIGESYQRKKKLDEASGYLARSEKYITPTTSSKTRYLLMSSSAWNAFYRSRLDEAEKLFKKAIDIVNNSAESYQSLHGLSAIYYFKGEQKEAAGYAERAISLAESNMKLGNVCQIILNTCSIWECLHEYEKLKQYLEKAITISKSLQDPHLIGLALEQKSRLLCSAGKYRDALSASNEALEFVERIQDRYRAALIKDYQVYILTELGDLDYAHSLNAKLWREFRQFLQSSILLNWNLLYRYKGDFNIAKLFLNKRNSYPEIRDNPRSRLLTEIFLCKTEIDACEIPAARDTFERCKRLFQGIDDPFARFVLPLCEAEILLEEGKIAESSGVISDLIKKLPAEKKELYSEALIVYGKTLIRSGEIEKGIIKLQESIMSSKTNENINNQAHGHFELAKALFDNKNHSNEALSHLDEAQTIFQRLEAKHYLEKINAIRTRYLSEAGHEPSVPTKYFESLSQVSELINQRLGKENFLKELLSITLKLTGAERGMVFLVDEKELYSIASHKVDSTTVRDAERISQTIINRLIQEHEPIYTSDATLDERFNRAQSILLNKIRSFICAPLKTDDKVIGTIYLDSKRVGLFNAENMLYFKTLGNLLATSIDKSLEFRQLQERLPYARKHTEFAEQGIVVCTSPVMRKLCSQLEQVAASEANVLIEGETGVGKGVLARMIHNQSTRKAKEFYSINCGVLPENIFESELFGTSRGAYTGATRDRIGLIEAASGSTVFFDEITNTSLAVQAKLLEVIEEKVIRRIGETRKRKLDARFIFATNHDLAAEVKAGRFREDLYFRINTITLRIPPLRERKDDIPLFVKFFMDKFAKEFKKMFLGKSLRR